MRKYLLAIIVGSVAFFCAGAQAAENCKPEVRIELTSKPLAKSYDLTCNLRLEPVDTLLTRVILTGPQATGVTLDCNGATLDGGVGKLNDGKDMIEVRSVLRNGEWLRPEDITVRNCNIIGSMRIMGMGQNGEADAVRESSRMDANHVQRLRAAAPTRITLDNLTVTGTSRSPIYLAPGVTNVTLVNSELKGDAIRTALYLDAETAYNTIKHNYFHVKILDDPYIVNRLGPQISVDTSSHNQIIGNRFSALEGGGIYLYRNCGEGRTVRHGSPSYNQIINNIFFYEQYDGENPAVFLGAHGQWWRDLPVVGHCGDDSGKPWGSSVSDEDHATHNVVMQNQIFKHSASRMIREGTDRSNRLNLVAHNDENLTAAIERQAGCYLQDGYKILLLSGEKSDVSRGRNGKPICSRTSATCSDGDLHLDAATDCRIRRVHFGCSITNNNGGCRRGAECPVGTRIVSSLAACNLEGGSISPGRLASVPGNRLTVLRPSDKASDGICRLAGATMRIGTIPIKGALDRRRVVFGCKEHDANGGDCQIAGMLFCR
jgi:Right handed beta helix region